MNRHWLFGGEQYYACGGVHDLIGKYPSIDSARAAAVEAEQQGRVEWWQIVVASSGVIVAQSECLPYGGERICGPPEKNKKLPERG